MTPERGVGPLEQLETTTWPDLALAVAATPARIRAGVYDGHSVTLHTFRAFGRRSLRIDFNIFEGGYERGVVIAKIPAFFRVPEGSLASSSKLARLLDLVEPRARRQHRIKIDVLRDKLFRVEVGDVLKGANAEALTRSYSVVRQVLERIA
jgi:hypothetical protein